jgi:hypothetical protein
VPSNDDVVRLLTSIDRRLALLTATEERELRAAVRDELLRTPGRIAMFDSIDGQRTGTELAKLAGVGVRSGQLFVTELLGLGLVRQVPGTDGRAVIVEPDDAAIINWYLQRQSSS